MNDYSILPLFSSLLFLTCGLYLCYLKKFSRESVLFMMICLTTFGWQFTWFILFNNPQHAGFLVKVGYSSIIFIPMTLYHFVTRTLTPDRSRTKGIILVYSVGIFYLVILWFTPWYIQGYYIFFWGPYPKASFMHPPYVLFLTAILFKNMIDIVKDMRKLGRTSPQYFRLKYLFLSLLIYTLAAVDFLVNYGVEFYPFGVLFILVSILITFYAITAHSLMGTTPLLIRNSLLTIGLFTLWIIPSVIFLFIAERYLQGLFLRSACLSFVVVLLSFLFGRVKLRAELTLDSFLNKKRFEYRRALKQISDGLVSIYDLDKLTTYLAETFRSTFEIKKVALFLVQGDHLVTAASTGFSTDEENEIQSKKNARLIAGFLDAKGPVIIDLLSEDSFLRKELQRLKVQLCLPFIFKDNLLGVCLMGERDFEYDYREADLDILKSLTNQIAVAIQTALAFKEIQDLNVSLDQKVRERTLELQNTLKELNDAYEKLKELDRAKMSFFTNVSHELRTPLTLIIAPMESMIKGKTSIPDALQKGLLEIMYFNALRLLKLINNLLDLAKLDAGRQDLFMARVDIIKFVRGIIASVEPMAEKKNIKMINLLPESLPEAYLDRDKIEKVILNLIFNSLKFTELGGTVKLLCKKEDGRFQFCIEDTGIGIAPEYLPRLFERFSQADASSARKYEGTGIGMALAKEFVELHQGKIWVESEIGKGTKVFFTLPHVTSLSQGIGKPDKRVDVVEVDTKKRDKDWTRELQEQALYHGEERTVIQSDLQIPTGEPEKRLLLLVEDNLDMLNFLVFQLQNEYRLATARNGLEGIDAVRKHRPDLVISDVMMPIKDGYELCREIKDDVALKHTPIILLTAKTDLSMKIEGLEQGADEYLTKPFSSDELRARIRSLLRARDLERDIQNRNEALEKALSELKETQIQLVHSAKMASIGQLAAGIAHEMNNPLTFVTSSLFTLNRSLQRVKEGQLQVQTFFDSAYPVVERVTLGVKRAKAIIDDLMNFARHDVEGLKEEDLNEGIRSVLTLLESRLGDRVNVHLDLGNIPHIECVLGQVNQVLMNLLLNALDAVSEGGQIWLSTTSNDLDVEIRVRDNGKGIPDEIQSRIFEPFFTTKDVGKGTGLGLSISHRIIENHGGTIQFWSKPDEGTEFLVRLPVRRSAAQEISG